jgi:hypothetical protein
LRAAPAGSWRRGGYGITTIPALAFQMIADDFPFAGEHLAVTRRRGVALDHYNKLSIFDPDAVTETRYAVGRHTAAPEGDIRYPRLDRLLLFHYKFLGVSAPTTNRKNGASSTIFRAMSWRPSSPACAQPRST